jgi:hypothetical protein
MSGVGAAQAASSADAMAQVLKSSITESTELAEKMMKVSVSMTVGAELGKGGAVDASA